MTLSPLRSGRAGDRVAAVRAAVTDPTTVLLACQLLSAGTAFVANIAAARTLEPAGRGELALLLQIAYLSSLGLLLGTDRSVVAVCSGRAPRDVARIATRLLVAPSSIVGAVAVLLLTVPVPGLDGWGVRFGLAGLFTVVNAFTKAVRAVAIASDRRRAFLVYGVSGEVLMLGAIALFVAVGVTSSAVWMVGYLVAGTLPTAVLLARWSRADATPDATPDAAADVAPDAADGDAGLRSRARREGLALVPATVAHSGTLRVDRLLLAALASTAALGIYATVATMTELIAWPLLAFADSRLGRWREAHDAGTLSLRRLVLATLAYAAASGAVLAVVLHLLLVPLLGPEYEPALALVGPLVLAAAVFGLSQILVTALTAVRRAGLASVVEVAGLVVSAVAYVVLIAAHGAVGAAWGSVIGYSAVTVFAGLALTAARRTGDRT